MRYKKIIHLTYLFPGGKYPLTSIINYLPYLSTSLQLKLVQMPLFTTGRILYSVCVCETFKQETGQATFKLHWRKFLPGSWYYLLGIYALYRALLYTLHLYTLIITLLTHCHYLKSFQAKIHMFIQVVNNSLTSKRLLKCYKQFCFKLNSTETLQVAYLLTQVL